MTNRIFAMEQSGKLYSVLHGKQTVNFYSMEDAFRYAKDLLNGSAPEEKKKRGGDRGVRYPEAVSNKKKEFILAQCATGPVTARNIMDFANKSSDPDIRNVPAGTWSGLISMMNAQKKISVTQRDGTRCWYKKVG